MTDLIYHGCFNFKSSSYKPTSDYQCVPLSLVFGVKHNLRRKARIVILGNQVDLRDFSTRAILMKGISVKLISLIAHRDGIIKL